MMNRDFGMLSATMRSILPPANNRLASRSTPCGVVRSLIPTSTEPRPSTSTSPPSMVARPSAMPSDHRLKSAPANVGCQR
jgi:hypothetical protein